MSDVKFTPGPWTADDFNDSGDWRIIGLSGRVCLVHPYMPKSDEEVNANAQLIAAAPDLYEALTGIMSLLESGQLVRNTDEDAKPGFAFRQLGLVTTLKKASDAIAKSHQSISAKR